MLHCILSLSDDIDRLIPFPFRILMERSKVLRGPTVQQLAQVHHDNVVHGFQLGKRSGRLVHRKQDDKNQFAFISHLRKPITSFSPTLSNAESGPSKSNTLFSVSRAAAIAKTRRVHHSFSRFGFRERRDQLLRGLTLKSLP